MSHISIVANTRCPAHAECSVGAEEVSNYMRLLARNDANYAHLSDTQEYKDMLQMFKDNDTSQVQAASEDEGGCTGGASAEEQMHFLQCSMCSKWRRVPDSYESEHGNWLCKDNPDTNFNECGVEQELTNEQIDELCDYV